MIIISKHEIIILNLHPVTHTSLVFTEHFIPRLLFTINSLYSQIGHHTFHKTLNAAYLLKVNQIQFPQSPLIGLTLRQCCKKYSLSVIE